MIFFNEEQLRNEIIKNLTTASISSMEDTKKVLQKNIAIDVYGGYSPQVYPRTIEFLEAWETEGGGADGVAPAQMHYEPEFITTVSPPQHASVITGASVVGILPDWIFSGHDPGIFPGGWSGARDAWKHMDKEITNTVFRNMYESGLSKTPMPWKRSTGAVIKTKD